MMDSGVAVGAVAEPHADSKDHEEVQEHSLQYEERIAELHSIIAELNRRIGLLQCTTNREKSAFSELHSRLNHSHQEATEDLDEDQVSCVSRPEKQSVLVTADIDNCSDLNLELQRVLMGLETVVCGRKKSLCSLSVAEVDRHIKQLTTASQHCDLAIKTVEELEGALGKDFYPSLCEERVQWEKELAGLQEENESLTVMLTSKDEEHNHTKATMSAIREERDRLRCHVRELQTQLQSIQIGVGQFSPCRVIPAGLTINLSPGELGTSNSSSDIPVAKVAERVKLSKTQTESLERAMQVSEITSIGVSSSVEEHLAHSLQDCSNIQEIVQTFYSHGSSISDNRLREFEVETERLHSRIEHLKSQNDLLTITLEECKNNAERMSMLMGKYESNATALRLALHYSEQCIEAYELLLALTEKEQGLVLGQNKVAEVSTVESAIFNHIPGEQGNEESVPHDYRKTAETTAKDLLVRLDGSCGDLFTATGCNVQPWESLSSNSHTRYICTTSSCDTDFSKEDEQHLKDYIQQLKNDRAAIKLTMLELESVHIDTLRYDIKPCVDSHRLDLENAVLMQELMAMKEEIAEMKAQLYLLEKEKKALELKLSSQETQEQAYLVQIEHLKSELEEQHEQRRRSLSSTGSSTKDKSGKDTSVTIVSELRSISYSDPAAELNNALQKEMKLKLRVKDLVAALEKLTNCSEIRHQQSAEFVNDLKQANSNLVAAYEKAKKKQQNKLKKLESQMMAMVERHETQVRMLKQRITLLEEETSHQHTNETSL
ncbi:colorectal mutant cancer protein isoform X3 [Tachysurus fulvidraco]|uniref:colorectal mutant cancer protein isoform X3 n=1 Tax=Tachysurus fulvidraco TaxID=1234273 RepID=UPI001FF048A1|nr:colorectal mutant cancer protein isoform X3 [Tachysurus fulvidraco]